MINPSHTKKLYTVGELTKQIKHLLEDTFPFVWVKGEISNIGNPSSGHSYFTLKDSQAVIQSVIFRQQKKQLKFDLANGLNIIGMARLSVYEPRGAYQLIFEHVEPEGIGSLQLAFEQLKERLALEGLFDARHKTELPLLPDTISIITSETGAALRDMLNVIQRRFNTMTIEIFPVQVQGDLAPGQICQALAAANRRNRSQVIILARGGGSLEDLHAFNTEKVARSVFDSRIPVITGIGHETDFTIVDFVADLRAPTPSAAAELAVPEKKILLNTANSLQYRLTDLTSRRIDLFRQTVVTLKSRLKSPKNYIEDIKFRLSELEERMQRSCRHALFVQKEQLRFVRALLEKQSPEASVSKNETEILSLKKRLGTAVSHKLADQRNRIDKAVHVLGNLNPHAVLKRGYTIAYHLPGRRVLTRSDQAGPGDQVELILAQGKLTTKVIKEHGKKEDI
ncbi:MAG: exodeoxyribonuclease VII large subunit [Desulfobacteraceae bacterium]|nr:MAG: exodeoxyribonuclease VII large subunit [Desulfobacteraceae bacterium]